MCCKKLCLGKNSWHLLVAWEAGKEDWNVVYYGTHHWGSKKASNIFAGTCIIHNDHIDNASMRMSASKAFVMHPPDLRIFLYI